MLIYRLTPGIYDHIGGIHYDSFVAPDLPENIAWLYAPGDAMLSSITHEGWYALRLDADRIDPETMARIGDSFQRTPPVSV